jgi:Transposase DDE domain
MTENNGYVLAPVPVAPVNETDMVLFPEGLKALKKVAKEVGLDLKGAYLNLDGGFDSAHNRKCIFNAGLIPNIKENPRNRKTTKRGRKRLFNAAIHALRMRVERTFAWEDKFKRLLLRFERIQQRHYGMKLLAYTFEFIPIKSSVATGSGAPGSCGGRSRVPSRNHGRPPSTGGCGL